MRKISTAVTREIGKIEGQKLTIGLDPELPSYDRRVPVTALIARPNFHRRDGGEVDKQVAAPAETRTPNWHRANKIAHQECGWKGGDSGDSVGRKTLSYEKTKEPT